MGYVHGTMSTALLAVARVADKQGDLAEESTLLREGLPLAEGTREVDTAQLMAELFRKTSGVAPTQRAMLRPEGRAATSLDSTSPGRPDMRWFVRNEHVHAANERLLCG